MTLSLSNPRALLGVLLILLPAAASAKTPPATVPLGGELEMSFTLPGQPGNPFDPADNDVDVASTGQHSSDTPR